MMCREIQAFRRACFVIFALVVSLLSCCGKTTLKDPIFSGFSPASGIVGTQVTITGDRFDTTPANNVVRFNGIRATVISATTTEVVVAVPEGATTGPITVTTANGTAGSISSFFVTRLLGGGIQGFAPVLTNTVSTVAGSAGIAGSADGIGGTARFNRPFGVTTDGFNVFITDRNNNTIRRMNIATGNVTTLAGSPSAFGSTNGTSSSARFNSPTGITTDGANLYVCDTSNHTIRKIVIATGVVSTIAGSPGVPGTVDGTGSSARFNSPTGITTDGADLYICDTANNTIRRLDLASGAVSTLAGFAGSPGFFDGTAAAARFNAPSGITTDGTNLFVADRNNNAIRKLLIATSQVTTIANIFGFAGSADGNSGNASFRAPSGISSDGFNLYITDLNNQTIRTFIPASSSFASGQVITIAGFPLLTGTVDAVGTVARFNDPTGITNTDTSLFIADSLNHTIRMMQ